MCYILHLLYVITDLYNRQLVYCVIPVYDTDYIVVPPLKGFVMNRVSGDYFETLLYKVFVTINEQTQVSELANVLQIDSQDVKVSTVNMSTFQPSIFFNKEQTKPILSVL